MARTSRAVMERNARWLLTFLTSSAETGAWTSISYRDFQTAASLTENQVRRMVYRLKERGFIEVVPRQADDGGTLPNEYRVTPLGIERLAAPDPLVVTFKEKPQHTRSSMDGRKEDPYGCERS